MVTLRSGGGGLRSKTRLSFHTDSYDYVRAHGGLSFADLLDDAAAVDDSDDDENEREDEDEEGMSRPRVGPARRMMQFDDADDAMN